MIAATHREHRVMIKRFSRAGFALTDVVITVLVVAMLGGCILAAAVEAEERARRIECMKNIHQIGRALLLYANENRGAYPAARRAPGMKGGPVFFTNWKAPDPMKPDGPEFNDVTAALFLLMRGQAIEAKAFRCPSTETKPIVFGDDPGAIAKDSLAISNFPGPEYLSYSYCNPYPGVHAVGNGFRLNNAMPGEFAVASDLNPGGDAVIAAKADAMPPTDPGVKYEPEPAKPLTLTDAQKAANSP